MPFTLAFLWCLLVLVPQQAPLAQPPKSATGLIVGQVVDATTGRPVANATVTIGAPGSKRVLVSDSGGFLFRDLAKAWYSLTATALGYLDGGYGQRRIGGALQPFALAEDQKVGDVVIRLWKEASIAGVITDDIGGPVVGIEVSLVRRDTAGTGKQYSLATTTRADERGVYRFAGLFPGDYLVAVTNKMTSAPADTPMDSPSDQAKLRASGSFSMSSMARTPAVRVGNMLLLASPGGSAGTNHLLATLPLSTAGGAAGAGLRFIAYSTTYYPNGPTPLQATVLSIAVGVDRTDVNLRMTPVTTSTVSGRLIGPDGPLARFPIHLIPAHAANGPLERWEEAADTVTDAAGAFTFLAVPPGSYVLKGYRLPVPAITDREIVPDSSLWGQTSVTVGADPVSGVALTLQPGGTISGKVVFDGSIAPPTPAVLQSTVSGLVGQWFEPAWPVAVQEGIGVRGRVSATGEFQSLGLPPGSYTAKLRGGPTFTVLRGWYLDSVALEGKDLTSSPVAIDGQHVTGVVVTFTDRATQLSGTVHDQTGKPDPAASVLIFPADYKSWIQNGVLPQAAQVITASQTGSFQVPDVKPGDYLVAAIGDATLATWQQAATIEALAPLATKVTLARGDSKQIDLKTVRR